MNLIIKSSIAHNVKTSVLSIQWWFYFTFIHLADAFIQSVIHWIQGTQIISTFFPGNRTHYRQFELWGGYTKIIRFLFYKNNNSTFKLMNEDTKYCICLIFSFIMPKHSLYTWVKRTLFYFISDDWHKSCSLYSKTSSICQTTPYYTAAGLKLKC